MWRVLRPAPLPALLLHACLLQCLSLSALAGPAVQLGTWRWAGVDRVFAVGDIHGAYAEFTDLLKAGGIVDESLHWIAGNAHLVSLGDLVDRGTESRKVMDLLMRLQTEAGESGGQVHVLVGNHEIMNLMGDLRYVSAAEFAAFSPLETPEMRERGYRDFLRHKDGINPSSSLGRRLDDSADDKAYRQVFADRFSPGFFGHRQAFSPEGIYGRWLLSLPIMIVINDTVFTHGGLPPMAAADTLEQLNSRYHDDIRRYIELWRQLAAEGVLLRNTTMVTRYLARTALAVADPSSCPENERATCDRQRAQASDAQRHLSPEQLAALRELVRLDESSLLGPDGPLWYRGSVRCNDILEQPVLERALANLDATRLVVGHTPTYDRQVHEIRDGQVVQLDTGMLSSHYRGRPALLRIEGSEIRIQYLKPVELGFPRRFVADASYPLEQAQLLDALRDGAIASVEKPWFADAWQVGLMYDGMSIEALFYPGSSVVLAAFELDRLLGFDIVPPAVSRTIEGREGALQLAFPESLSEAERTRRRLDYEGRCPLQPQRQLVDVFDALIGKRSRDNSSIRYMKPSWSIYVTDYGDAFGTDRQLEGAVGELSPGEAAALRALDAHTLSQATGRWLNEGQQTALLARRDALLQSAHILEPGYPPAERH